MQRYGMTVAMVRTLKGAPLSCLIALALVRQPVEAGWLEMTTGYSDKPVLQALKLLKEYGFVSRNSRNAWQVCAGIAMQLPLSTPQLDVPLNSFDPEEPVASGDNGIEDTKVTTRNFSDPENFRVPSSSCFNDSKKELNMNLQLQDSSEIDPEKIWMNLEALIKHGIRNPALERLANLPHVSPDLINFHCKHCQSTGQAIYRIEHGWTASKKTETRWIESENEQPEEQENLEIALPSSTSANWGEAVQALPISDPAGYLSGTRVVSVDADVWVVRAANCFAASWISERAAKPLTNELKRITGRNLTLQIIG